MPGDESGSMPVLPMRQVFCWRGRFTCQPPAAHPATDVVGESVEALQALGAWPKGSGWGATSRSIPGTSRRLSESGYTVRHPDPFLAAGGTQ